MSCQDLVCKETEYQARNAKVINSVPFPDTQACRKNQASAETQAKTRVDSDVSKQKKECACETDFNCECDDLPPWPAAAPFGWQLKKSDKGLKRDVPVVLGLECTWTVTVQYDRWHRSRSADCLENPLPQKDL